MKDEGFKVSQVSKLQGFETLKRETLKPLPGIGRAGLLP
jgi:hypothetical protein